jgi:hypothetical protein
MSIKATAEQGPILRDRSRGEVVMTTIRTGGATALALALLLGAAPTAVAQSATEDLHHPETGPQAEQSRPTTPGSGPAQGMMMMDPQMMQEMMRHMMAHGMMGQGIGPGMMQQMPGMMGQMPQGQVGPGTMGPGMMQQMPGMMGQMPQGQMGPGMMGPGMMQQMPGMMGQMPQDQMGPGMMGQGMMQQMPGMMSQGLTGRMPGHGALGGWRVTPVMHLGVEDVQHSLEHFIEVHDFQHLKVGEVRETDDDTIAAEIVTQEGSLALQLEVDRHTGLVRRVG